MMEIILNSLNFFNIKHQFHIEIINRKFIVIIENGKKEEKEKVDQTQYKFFILFGMTTDRLIGDFRWIKMYISCH